MVDQVKVTETLAKLDKELTSGEPYILGLPGNKRLVFEDFTSWTGEKAERAEEIMSIATGFQDEPMDVFAEKWLSAKDYKTWNEQGFSFKQKASILQRASKHVLKGLTPGESDASSSS